MTYTLYNLMLFWEVESKQDFTTIKEILQIAGSEKICDTEKKNKIVVELRNSGLFEEEYILSPEQEEMNRLAWVLITNLNNRPKL